MDSGSSTSRFVRVIQTSPDQITLEFNPPAPQFETRLIQKQSCQAVNIPGIVNAEIAGLPSMPVQGVMLGIPQEAQPSIQLLAADSILLAGSHDLCPAPHPLLDRSNTDQWRVSGYSYDRSPRYQVDADMPSATAELVSTGNLRSQRYAEIRFNPLKYNPITNQLRYYHRIQVVIHFNTPKNSQAMSQGKIIPEGPFENSLRSLLINYDQASQWRKQSGSAEMSNTQAPHNQPLYKILVNQDGLYQVSYAALQAAGVPVGSLDPHTFQIFNQLNELAIYVEGEDDGTFDPSDYILFYGQKLNTKYTDTNVYWLTWGESTGRRMTNMDGTPSGSATIPTSFFTTRHVETNTKYRASESSGLNNDHWYWDEIIAFSGPSSKNFSTTLEHLAPISKTISIRGLLKGFAGNPNHHTRIYLNNQLIDDHTFPSGDEYSFNFNRYQSDLIEGTNTLKVECPHDGEITIDYVAFNWFEIDYYDAYLAENDRLFFDGDDPGSWEFRVDGFSDTSIEAYDLTDPLSPVRTTGGVIQSTSNGQQIGFEATISSEHHYLAETINRRLNPLSISQDIPSSWKSPSIGADYIIISHNSFLSQVQPLADFRQSQGLRVQVVDVQDLYDEFNGGVFDPEAIRSFLAYAYSNWIPPAPSFVLLVGDGNFDYRNFLVLNVPNYIPPILDEIDPWVGENVTDNRYVSVSGDDILPDMYIGRFPVRNATEAQTMVEKTIDYEQIPPSGGWNAVQTFLADNADEAGDFDILSDQIINNYVPSAYTIDKIYYGVNYVNAGVAKAALLAGINQGRLIVHYSGHGSTQDWAVEDLLNINDLSALTNGSKLPFIIPMTCADGYFIWPQASYSSLGESIVRLNGGGAIASWSPTGFGLSSGHELLDESLFSNLFIFNNTQIGYLTTNAKYHLYATSSNFNDLIETYILFGDPALKLQVLPNTRQLYYLPMMSR